MRWTARGTRPLFALMMRARPNSRRIIAACCMLMGQMALASSAYAVCQNMPCLKDARNNSPRRLHPRNRAVCCVANARDSYGYHCALRLASHPDPGRRLTVRVIQSILKDARNASPNGKFPPWNQGARTHVSRNAAVGGNGGNLSGHHGGRFGSPLPGWTPGVVATHRLYGAVVWLALPAAAVWLILRKVTLIHKGLDSLKYLH